MINLYGVPRYFEIDPTPFVSLFFAMFFGLCLTDAGYGVILAILTLIFAFRMKSARQFLMLIFIGSIFTIFAGAIFNGWFGDLPSYLGLGDFFDKIAVLGDPVRSDEGSMNFFRLALGLGAIHVIFGLFIKFFDSIRRRDWGGAFLDGLPWLTIIISLLIILLSTDMAVSMQLVSAPIFPSRHIQDTHVADPGRFHHDNTVRGPAGKKLGIQDIYGLFEPYHSKRTDIFSGRLPFIYKAHGPGPCHCGYRSGHKQDSFPVPFYSGGWDSHACGHPYIRPYL